PAGVRASHGAGAAGGQGVPPAGGGGRGGGPGGGGGGWGLAGRRGRHAGGGRDQREWPAPVALDEAEPQERRVVGPHRRELVQLGGGDIEQLLEQRAGRIRLRPATLERLVQPADARLHLGRDHASQHIAI